MTKKFIVRLALAATMCAVLASGAMAMDREFVISFWFAPPMSDDKDMRVAEMAEANFNINMNACTATTVKDNLETLDACQKYGMKAIVKDDRILAKSPNDPDFEKNLDAVIADYAKHPALYGYFVTDEPGPNMFPSLAAISQYMLKKDPKHLPYINILPNYVEQWPEAIGNVPYTQHVDDYMKTVTPALLSYDHYAIYNDNKEGERFFENLETIRAAALKYGTPWANIILTTPHFNYRDPDMNDLRWQVYNSLAYGATGIIYFTYWTPGPNPDINFRNGIIDPDGKRTVHYEMVKKLNAEMKVLAPTLLKLKSTAVYNTGTLPKGTTALPAGTLIKSIDGGEFVIGFFEGPNKSQYVMLTNRNIRAVTSAVVTFAKSGLSISEIDKTSGKAKNLQVESLADATKLQAGFKAGEGRLYLIEKS